MDKDIKVGDRITFKTIREIHTRLMISSEDVRIIQRDCMEILKIERIGENGWYTVYEKKELLTDEEKEFLKAFRNISRYRIERVSINSDRELRIDRGQTYTNYIPTGKFKNLEVNKWYTLKELGLED